MKLALAIAVILILGAARVVLGHYAMRARAAAWQVLR